MNLDPNFERNLGQGLGLDPIEQELQTLFQERAGAVLIETVPPIPATEALLAERAMPINDRNQRRDRARFWLATAASAALLLAAGWVLIGGVESAPFIADATNGGDPADPTNRLEASRELPLQEIAEAKPASVDDTTWWLNHWAVDGPYVVVTAADWCPHCQEQLPALIELLGELSIDDKTVPVLGVGAAGDPIWTQVGWPYPVLELGDVQGPDQPLPEGLDFYPAVAVWSTTGIVGEPASADSWTDEDMRNLVTNVLRERD